MPFFNRQFGWGDLWLTQKMLQYHTMAFYSCTGPVMRKYTACKFKLCRQNAMSFNYSPNWCSNSSVSSTIRAVAHIDFHAPYPVKCLQIVVFVIFNKSLWLKILLSWLSTSSGAGEGKFSKNCAFCDTSIIFTMRFDFDIRINVL